MADRTKPPTRRRGLLPLLLAACGACDETRVPRPRQDAGPLPFPPPATLGAGFVDITPSDLRPGVFPRPGDARGRRLKVSGAFVDMDGDGRDEVVFTHRDPTPAGPGVPLVWRLADGALRAAPDLDLPIGVLPVLVSDLDGDGHVDVVGLRPDSPRPGQTLAEVSGHVAFLYGLGGGRYDEVVGVHDVPGFAPAYALQSVALTDLDADGWVDLLYADNGCCSNCRALHPVLRTGLRSYEDRPDLLRGDFRGGAYTAIAAPLFGESLVLAAVGWLCADSQHAFFRAGPPGEDGYARFDGFDPTPRDASFRDMDKLDCPTIACRAPMAAAWSDLDDDGLLDVFIAFNPMHALFRGTAAPPWVDRSDWMPFREIMGPRRELIPWGSALVDLDRDGRDDLLSAHGDDDTTAYDPGQAVGPQRTTAYWNATSLHFADITALTHLDRAGQWHSLTLGDPDGDGDVDLVVGGFGEPPRVYRNEVTGGHGLSLRLRGTLSNAYGAGARVETFLAGRPRPMTRVMGSYASPMQGNQPLLFLGAGASKQIARVRVTWPSGVVQELTDLPVDRALSVTEPLGFSIDPPSRHVRADGRSAVTLRVTPPAGQTVGARLRGPGSVAVTRDGDAWAVRVVSAPTAGSATVTLTLDGVELRVRPRIWWDAPRGP